MPKFLNGVSSRLYNVLCLYIYIRYSIVLYFLSIALGGAEWLVRVRGGGGGLHRYDRYYSEGTVFFSEF